MLFLYVKQFFSLFYIFCVGNFLVDCRKRGKNNDNCSSCNIFFLVLNVADSLREFPFNSQSRNKREKKAWKNFNGRVRKNVYKRRIKTRQTGFLFDSLLLLSFYTLSWSFLFFCVAQANDFSINFWWKLEPQHSCSRQIPLLFFPSSMLSFIFSFFFDSTANLFMIFSSP